LTDEQITYSVAELHMTPADVLNEIADGLTEIGAGTGGSSIHGRLNLLLSVDAAFAESVEEAARRQGVKLERV
jgi:hypothetical protein